MFGALALIKRLVDRAIPIFLIVTFAKIAVFVLLAASNRAKPFVGDNAADLYIPIGRRLATEHRFNGVDSRPDSKVPPAYPAVLAVLMTAAPENWQVAAVCLQMLVDLAVAVLLLLLGTRFLSPACGAMAGLVWLLYPPEIAISTWITAEPIFTGLFAGSLILMLWWFDRNPGMQLLAGLVLGLAALFRGTPILLSPLLLIVFLKRRLYLQGIAFVLGFVLVVVPWSIRNRVVLHDQIAISVGFGSVFLQGSDERVLTIAGKRENMGVLYREAAEEGIRKPANNFESQIDHWLFEVGLYEYKQRLRGRPLSYLPFFARKFVLLWCSTEGGSAGAQLVLALCSLPIVVPGMRRLWVWNRVPTDFTLVCGAVAIYFILLHVTTLPLNRYMLPLYPILTLAACDAWLMWMMPQHPKNPASTSI